MRRASATLARRICAYAIDVALLATVLIPLTFAIQVLTGYRATTGLEVWTASVLTISVPSWTYFAVSDASAGGATIGKRLLRVRTTAIDGARLAPTRALLRTAVKLAPWELTHFALFGLATTPGTFDTIQVALVSSVYVLLAVYLIVAIGRSGKRSVHDLIAGSAVRSADAT